MIPTIIDEKKAAVAMGISLSMLRRMSYAGEGPARIKLGQRRVGYREADVTNWINSRTAYNGRGAKNAA